MRRHTPGEFFEYLRALARAGKNRKAVAAHLTALPAPALKVRLVPELRALAGDASRIWCGATVCHSTVEVVVVAWKQGSHHLAGGERRVDDAVVAEWQALGLARAAVRGL